MTIQDHVRIYVAKSGGIEKVRQLREAFTGIQKGRHGEYVTAIGKHEAGSQHLIGSALLGLVLAELCYEAERKESKL